MTNIEYAEVLGRVAFAAGQRSIPSFDSKFRALLICADISEGLTLLNAWTTAWHTANLEAPVFMPDGTRVDTWRA